MKKIFVMLMMASAVIMFAGCKKENITPVGPTAEEPTTMDIVRTSWKGVYEDVVQHPQAGQLPCILNWTMDFLDDSNVSIMLEMSVGGQTQSPQEMNVKYTFDGRHGELIYEEGDESQRDAFEVDPINRTLTIDFRITTGFSQENPQVVGGPTTFHQVR